jgi:uncharacterized membrane protein (Fun14 family)
MVLMVGEEMRIDMASGIGLEQLGLTVGSGAVLGGVLGYASKKLVKVAVVLAALEAGLLMYLEEKGVLNVYWGDFSGLLSGSGSSGEGITSGVSNIASLAGALPIGASFAGGFLLGFKKG